MAWQSWVYPDLDSDLARGHPNKGLPRPHFEDLGSQMEQLQVCTLARVQMLMTFLSPHALNEGRKFSEHSGRCCFCSGAWRNLLQLCNFSLAWSLLPLSLGCDSQLYLLLPMLSLLFCLHPESYRRLGYDASTPHQNHICKETISKSRYGVRTFTSSLW